VRILCGKHKADYNPRLDGGDMVSIINIGKIKFTGRKLVQKDFRHHSMYPGGLKRVPMKKVYTERPGDVIRHAVNGMLPKNRRRNTLMKRLTTHV
jgi:large subunit ribosomal protein L13